MHQYDGRSMCAACMQSLGTSVGAKVNRAVPCGCVVHQTCCRVGAPPVCAENVCGGCGTPITEWKRLTRNVVVVARHGGSDGSTASHNPDAFADVG